MNRSRLKKAYAAVFPHADKQYWYLRSFEFLTRILLVFIFVSFSTSSKELIRDSSLANWHSSISLIFYALLLIFMSNAIRKRALSGENSNLLRNMIQIKWALFLIPVILLSISISSYINHFDYNGIEFLQITGEGYNKVIGYHLRYLGNRIVVPNIGFLVITFLSFYLSESLKISKKLKEEQALTI